MEDEVLESASVSVRGKEKGCHLFVVKNFSLHKGIGVNEAIESEEFVVCGRRFSIRLYPGGKDVDARDAGFASLYVYLNKENTHQSVSCCFDMYLIDQSGKGNDWGCSYLRKPWLIEDGRMLGRDNFITRSSLTEYLKDDCLKIRVNIEVFTCRNQDLPLIKVPTESLNNSIRSDFGKLLQSKKGADVLFKVKNQSFCAHKPILAARCPFFLSYLSDGHQSNEIDVPDIDPEIFEAMLWFLYTGILREEEHDDSDFGGPLMIESFMGKILAAADRFELKKLKKICELRISDKISRESVAYVMHLAELCRAEELKAACLRFGAENGTSILDVVDSDGCKYLKETCPLLFLELAYKENYPINEFQKHHLCKKLFSSVKETFAGILRKECAIEDKYKIKDV
ncbi:hypothetical protein ABFX02_09G003900 [Erythranthe guttata]